MKFEKSLICEYYIIHEYKSGKIVLLFHCCTFRAYIRGKHLEMKNECTLTLLGLKELLYIDLYRCIYTTA